MGYFEKHLYKCQLCPRRCRVNRKERVGYCKVGDKPMVNSYFAHFGEEKLIVGNEGSGTVFFAGCNLRCVFCQNYEISWLMKGKRIENKELALIFAKLSEKCHNINLVTPTPHLPSIIEALKIARKIGRLKPIIYNTSGYERTEIIEKLKGTVQIYMPDIKFFDREACEIYLNARDYAKKVKETVKEMDKQVKIKIEKGVMIGGLIIRHLVMPNYTEDSFRIVEWIKRNVKNAVVNIMFQYRPFFKAKDFPKIARSISFKEWKEVYDYAKQLGLKLINS